MKGDDWVGERPCQEATKGINSSQEVTHTPTAETTHGQNSYEVPLRNQGVAPFNKILLDQKKKKENKKKSVHLWQVKGRTGWLVIRVGLRDLFQ